MEFPSQITPDENLLIKNEKEFKLTLNNKEYLIYIGISSSLEKLEIKIKELSSEPLNLYENIFSLMELKKVNKYFRIFDNIDELISFIEEIFEQKNADLKFENNNILLILKNIIGKKEELISLEIKKKLLSVKETCEYLSKENIILKNKINEIDELKNEIQLLKEENKKINEIINLKKK